MSSREITTSSFVSLISILPAPGQCLERVRRLPPLQIASTMRSRRIQSPRRTTAVTAPKFGPKCTAYCTGQEPSAVSRLDDGRGNLLGDIARALAAHAVHHVLAKHDRIGRDFDHVAVEHGVVLAQEITYVAPARALDDGDHVGLVPHDASEHDGINGQALLADAAHSTRPRLHAVR